MSSVYIAMPRAGSSSLSSATLNPGPLNMGANPAASGDVRMSSGGKYINWLDQAGTGDLTGIGFTTGDVLTLGDATNCAGHTTNVKTSGTHALLVNSVAMFTAGATYWTLGATASAATTTSIRLPKVATVGMWNNAGNADITALATDASDNVLVGESTNTAGTILNTKAGGTHSLRVNSVACLTTGVDYATIGIVANAATTGAIRLVKDGLGIYQRNHANSADVALVVMDNLNNIVFGDPTNALGIIVKAGAGQYINFSIGNAAGLVVYSSSSLSFGEGSGSVATTGNMKFPKNWTFRARNNGDTADITFIGTNAADNVIVGDATNTAGLLMKFKEIAAPAAPAADTFYFYIDSTTHALMVKSPGGVATQISPA